VAISALARLLSCISHLACHDAERGRSEKLRICASISPVR